MSLDLAPAPREAAVTLATAAFARHGRVRIEPFLGEPSARALHHHLDRELEWWRVVNRDDKVWDLGPQAIAAMGREGEAKFLTHVHAGARDGFQFLFDSVRIADEPAERAGRGLLIDKLLDALNAADSLGLFRRVVGDVRIARVDGQATRYLAGHFLTGHDDAVSGKDRIAAYVLSLTPAWRTEWGGMLQFHDARGDVSWALKPSWNALHVFRVPQLHSVSYVAPFAGAPRYSITGWLRGS